MMFSRQYAWMPPWIHATMAREFLVPELVPRSPPSSLVPSSIHSLHDHSLKCLEVSTLSGRNEHPFAVPTIDLSTAVGGASGRIILPRLNLRPMILPTSHNPTIELGLNTFPRLLKTLHRSSLLRKRTSKGMPKIDAHSINREQLLGL
ncbi:uncharacterized protein LOC120290153 [Eucalyptus grandis]|uniref:uncharacterized protein LOC120290153 n=1 Tax=Eucalyptus grandis TaxID=71139 RepID=UPI00192EC5D8|nr:uncharacterized protein LOC120290153 [Eucalyptus grandis]